MHPTKCPECGSRNYHADLLEHTHEVPELQDTRFTCNDCNFVEITPAT